MEGNRSTSVENAKLDATKTTGAFSICRCTSDGCYCYCIRSAYALQTTPEQGALRRTDHSASSTALASLTLTGSQNWPHKCRLVKVAVDARFTLKDSRSLQPERRLGRGSVSFRVCRVSASHDPSDSGDWLGHKLFQASWVKLYHRVLSLNAQGQASTLQAENMASFRES